MFLRMKSCPCAVLDVAKSIDFFFFTLEFSAPPFFFVFFYIYTVLDIKAPFGLSDSLKIKQLTC